MPSDSSMPPKSYRPYNSQSRLPLKHKVALVTGATRGVGKGIAIALGQAGATVYITGRSVKPEDAPTAGIPGSLQETHDAIAELGGECIPVATDHGNDEQVRSLFHRIQTEQDGQLDILVNNVYGGVTALRAAYGKAFWENDIGLWDACNNVGLRSHYVASIYAARMMVPRQQGLICTISSWGSLSPIFGVAYGAGKSACDRLAAEMARELKPHGVTSLSLWPGIVGTEHISQIFDEAQRDQNATPPTNSSNREQSRADPTSAGITRDRYNWETPLLTGRVIAALAADSDVIRRAGRVNIVAEVAKTYGVVDEGGTRPASLRSLRFVVPYAIPPLQSSARWIPDIRIPWWLMLITSLTAPKVARN